MKISKQQSIQEDWDEVRSWNYKISSTTPKQSVVYAELDGDHGEVSTNELERIYYILDGDGEFVYDGETIKVQKDDVITVPPNTVFNYHPTGGKTLKVILFMELWDN